MSRRSLVEDCQGKGEVEREAAKTGDGHAFMGRVAPEYAAGIYQPSVHAVVRRRAPGGRAGSSACADHSSSIRGCLRVTSVGGDWTGLGNTLDLRCRVPPRLEQHSQVQGVASLAGWESGGNAVKPTYTACRCQLTEIRDAYGLVN